MQVQTAGETKTNTTGQKLLYMSKKVVLHFQVQGQPQLYNKNLGVFHKVLQDKTALKGQPIVGISLVKNGTSILNAQVSNICWRIVMNYP